MPFRPRCEEERDNEIERRRPVPSLRATKNTRTNGLAYTPVVVVVVVSSSSPLLSADIFAKGARDALVCHNYVE